MTGLLAMAAIDGLKAHVAILDGDGIILAVNAAWRRFAMENSHPDWVDFVGQNYISVCARTPAGAAAARGLSEIIAGTSTEFCLEYPCHNNDEHRWFRMRATPVAGVESARVVVLHEDVTAQKLAEDSLRQMNEGLEGRVRERTEALASANKSLYVQIEERRTAAAALRYSNEQLTLALRAGKMGVWQIDLGTNLVTRSDGTDLLFGLEPGSPSRPLGDYVARMHPDDVASVQQTIARCIEKGSEQYVEYRTVMDDGSIRWIASRGQVCRHEPGSALLLVGATVDITRGKLTEEALRDSEARYRLLFERNPHSMWLYDVETRRFLAVNDAAVCFYGYTRDEFLAMTIRDIRPPEEVERIEQFLTSPAVHNDTTGIWRHRKKDGTVVSVEVIAHTVTFQGGAARLILSNDVTDRLRAEAAVVQAQQELENRVQSRTAELASTLEALRESEELFRQIAENIGEVFWMTNRDKSKMIYVSPAYETTWGRSCRSLYDDPVSFLSAIVPEDRDRVRENLAMQAGGETTATYRVGTGTGAIHWIRDRSFPIRNRAGDVYRIAGIAENITDLKDTEEEISRLAMIVEGSDDAIFGNALDGSILSWNSGAMRIYGYAAEETIGKSSVMLAPAEQRAEVTQLLYRVGRGEQVASLETTRLRKSGERFNVSLTLSAVRDASGKVIGISAIERDVTERKRLEREILEIGERERQRISQDLHDGLGQHLTGIAFLSKALQQQLGAADRPESNDAAQIADLVQQAIGQTRALARGLRPVQESPGGLASALQELAGQVEAVFRINCSVVCPRQVYAADTDAATNLYRIAQEAVNNAIKHGKAKCIRISLRGSRRLLLKIEDDGCGIDPHIARRAAEPGNDNIDALPQGMGLRIMAHRAKMIGGILDVKPGSDRGTVVSCLISEQREASSGVAPEPSVLSGGEHGHRRNSRPKSRSSIGNGRAKPKNPRITGG